MIAPGSYWTFKPLRTGNFLEGQDCFFLVLGCVIKNNGSGSYFSYRCLESSGRILQRALENCPDLYEPVP